MRKGTIEFSLQTIVALIIMLVAAVVIIYFIHTFIYQERVVGWLEGLGTLFNNLFKGSY